MDFDKFNEIVQSRKNYGELDQPSVVSEYKNVGCGDGYRIYFRINNNIIEDVSFTTTGCSFSIASLSILSDLMRGCTISEAREIKGDIMEEFIDGYPERRKIYIDTTLAAMRKALDDFEQGTGLKDDQFTSRKNVIELLKKNGHLKNQNMHSVMLEDLDFSGIDFSGSNLQHAYLKGCNLSNTNLTGTNLRGAFMNRANLTNATVLNADLRFAKLAGAKLQGAVFDGSLYDIGTRVDTASMKIFETMVKKGKAIYVK